MRTTVICTVVNALPPGTDESAAVMTIVCQAAEQALLCLTPGQVNADFYPTQDRTITTQHKLSIPTHIIYLETADTHYHSTVVL